MLDQKILRIFLLVTFGLTSGMGPKDLMELDDDEYEEIMFRDLKLNTRLTFTKNTYFFIITLPTFIGNYSVR